MGLQLAPCDAFARGQALPPGCLDGSWEVGRLVLAPEYRTGPDALRRCLFLTLVYLIEHTGVQNFFASCNPLLARLYRRFGFSALGRVDAAQGCEPFVLIHGSVQDVMEALAGDAAERSRAERLLALRTAGARPC